MYKANASVYLRTIHTITAERADLVDQDSLFIIDSAEQFEQSEEKAIRYVEMLQHSSQLFCQNLMVALPSADKSYNSASVTNAFLRAANATNKNTTLDHKKNNFDCMQSNQLW